MKSTKMKRLLERLETDELMGFENPEYENEFMVRAEKDILKLEHRERVMAKYLRKEAIA